MKYVGGLNTQIDPAANSDGKIQSDYLHVKKELREVEVILGLAWLRLASRQASLQMSNLERINVGSRHMNSVDVALKLPKTWPTASIRGSEQ